MITLLHALDIIGIIAFAATGAITAGKKDMDVFGGLVLAFVTGIGGGTLRDMMLGTPAFWLNQPIYIAACFAGFFIVYFFLWRFKDIPRATIKLVDAVGLAVFTMMGTQKALDFAYPASVAVMMGLLTGCGGGLIRDVLANDIPLILRRNKLYATASLAGGLAYVLVDGWSSLAAMILCILTVLIIRIGALFLNWRLPFFPK